MIDTTLSAHSEGLEVNDPKLRIQVEIDERALKRLMSQKRLNVEEFRCLNREGKHYLKRLFLEMMVCKN